MAPSHAEFMAAFALGREKFWSVAGAVRRAEVADEVLWVVRRTARAGRLEASVAAYCRDIKPHCLRIRRG